MALTGPDGKRYKYDCVDVDDIPVLWNQLQAGRGAEGRYYRWGERIVHFVGSAGDEGIFEVGMGKGQGGTPGARRTSGEVDDPLPPAVQVAQILASHMGERGDPNETIVECLRRIIAERDQAMGATVIVPGR